MLIICSGDGMAPNPDEREQKPGSESNLQGCIPQPVPTTTRAAGGLSFTAKGGKRQGREVSKSLRVKPGAKHAVWKTQSKSWCNAPTLFYDQNFRFSASSS
jgi:hypothetical protein